ncbi:MAG: extracellular solute-binding protein [Caldilineaceae bacterium]|nr:extracellular solute-binding protein [Caldilineaceae bacterium]MBP8107030.1 extracellular solute-binding protein [Caldilineaceae bacterium]MBP8121976.1 extracellular solute-binding protein [Caldilineaceae bacterium]MBP9072659.1 extracellular solute-binding protein [Caldilineaceae bacterium]
MKISAMPTQSDPIRRPRLIGLGALLLSVLWILAACARLSTPPAPATAPPTPSAQSVPDSVLNNAAGNGSNSSVNSQGETNLVVWLPDFYSLDPSQPGGETLYTVRVLFEQTYPGVFLDLFNKAESGQAGLLNFLRAAQRVAPSVLPDAVILNTQDLWQAVDAGLVQPVDPAALDGIDDFYPFALDAATYNDILYGVPLSADLQHLVYARDYLLPQTGEPLAAPPLAWSQVISDGAPFIFTAGVREPARNLSLLLQYVGAGGSLSEDGTLTDAAALVDLFTFLAEARQSGAIPDRILGLLSEETTWGAFADGDAGLAAVNAHYYLSQREVLDQVGYGPVPTQDGTPSTVAQTWAIAILTPDPDRQALVVEFIQDLLEAEVLGPWNQSANRLPVRHSALQAWTGADPYYQFLDDQANLAVAIPNGKAFTDLAGQMQQAAQDVLAGNLSPQDALLTVQATP